MRYAINVNSLPPSIDIGSLEPYNVHWHPQPWPMNATKAYIKTAFASGVDPSYDDVPLCLDIEPVEMWDFDGALYQKYLNISTSARQRTRSVFPGRELWAYDPAGGRTPVQAMANVCSARESLDGLDAAGIGMYPSEDGSFDYDTFAYLSDAYREAFKRCWPHPALIGFVSHRAKGDRAPVTDDQFFACIAGAKKIGVDIIAHWQADNYFEGWDAAKATNVLAPFVNALRKSA